LTARRRLDPVIERLPFSLWLPLSPVPLLEYFPFGGSWLKNPPPRGDIAISYFRSFIVNFSEWWSPGSKAEAALDADIADLLWNDTEKRRKNAWLRKVGFVTRTMAYASIFGVMFAFMPESIRSG
jgi:hypothetical protein